MKQPKRERAAETGGGVAAPGRTCVVSRQVCAPDELIRFVVGPDGAIVPDIAQKLPGRGIWVSCAREAVVTAAKKNLFARSARQKVAIAPDLPDRLDALLVNRAISLLSLCNKAGLVVGGYSKVNAWLEAGANGALLQAADASPDGAAKLSRKYRAVCNALNRRPVEVTLLTIDQLSLAIGRSNVVHAALSDGKVAANFLAAARRVENYRGGNGAPTIGMTEGAAGAASDVGTQDTGQV